jgi:hypothetical protein
MLARGINMAFAKNLPDLDKFLEARLVENGHVSSGNKRQALSSLPNRRIKGTLGFNYCTMIADPW